MVVCLCKGVSDRKIQELIAGGCSTLREIVQSCQAGSDCGSCVCQVREMLEQAGRGTTDKDEPEALERASGD